MKTHKDLDAWRDSITLVTKVYQVTKTFPKSELYGIASQLKRAAVSIPSNISEGSARQQPKEFVRFLRISMASLSELETLFIISENVGLIGSDEMKLLQNQMIHVRSQISGLIRAISTYFSE